MKIVKEGFGTLKSGEEVTKYRIKNDKGFEVNVLNYGGIITEILAPDKTGNFENVVLGFDNIRDYEEKSPYFGSVVGRIAGRISGASFNIDGEEYNLVKNNGRNNLHGGEKGFDKVVWEIKEMIRDDYAGLELRYFSPDGEEGFPGNVDVKMEYLLNNNNEFEVKYNAISDKKTIINLTNHSYFNLSGDLKEDVLDHKLTINADRIGYVNNEVVPNGEIVDVDSTAFDFTKPKKVGQNINQDAEQLLYCGGYDHPFILNEDGNLAAKLEDEKSGRVLEITTDQPAVVFYSGNGLGKDLILSGNKKGKKHLALCLETQNYPDSINQESFPTKIYNPGEKYEAYTKYRFFTNI